MGCGIGIEEQQTAKSILQVATLVYTGSSISPFEFYSIDKDYKENKSEKAINKQFQKNLKDQNLNKERIRLLDLKVKKERYTPLYRKNCGVKNGIFQTRPEFQASWLEVFRKQALPVHFQLKEEYENYLTEQTLHPDLIHLRIFDYLCYVSIIQYLYELEDIGKIKQKMSVLKYYEFVQSSFNKPFLQEKNKISNLIQFTKKQQIDVFFIQNCTQQLRYNFEKKTDFRILMSQAKGEKAKKQQFKKNAGTMLLVREKSFKKAGDGKKGNRKFLQIFNDQNFQKHQANSFLTFGENVILSIDNFIFLGVNFSEAKNKKFAQSKYSSNKNQIAGMVKDLKILQKYLPKKYLVVGGNFGMDIIQHIGDALNQTQETVLKGTMMVYPTSHTDQQQLTAREQLLKKKEKMGESAKVEADNAQKEVKCFTTMKKATSMQLSYEDFQKNQIIDCSDQIIYDSRVKLKEREKGQDKTGRYVVDGRRYRGTQNDKFYMPNQMHPFAHLVVVKSIKIPRRIEKTRELHFDFGDDLFSSSSSDRSSKDGNQEPLKWTKPCHSNEPKNQSMGSQIMMT